MSLLGSVESEISSQDIKSSAYGNIFVLLCSSWLFAFLFLVTEEVTILLFASQPATLPEIPGSPASLFLSAQNT